MDKQKGRKGRSRQVEPLIISRPCRGSPRRRLVVNPGTFVKTLDLSQKGSHRPIRDTLFGARSRDSPTSTLTRHFPTNVPNAIDLFRPRRLVRFWLFRVRYSRPERNPRARSPYPAASSYERSSSSQFPNYAADWERVSS